MSSLCLHAGAKIIEMEQLRGIATPDATPTWTPVAHDALVDSVKGGAGFQRGQHRQGGARPVSRRSAVLRSASLGREH